MAGSNIKTVAALAVVLGTALLTSAHASPLTPGAGNVPPDVYLTSISGTVLASTSGSFSAPTINGTYSTGVIADSARGGMLDFVIQVTNLSGGTPLPELLERITNGGFFGFNVDAGYLATTGLTAGDGSFTLTSAPGNVVPVTMDE